MSELQEKLTNCFNMSVIYDDVNSDWAGSDVLIKNKNNDIKSYFEEHVPKELYAHYVNTLKNILGIHTTKINSDFIKDNCSDYHNDVISSFYKVNNNNIYIGYISYNVGQEDIHAYFLINDNDVLVIGDVRTHMFVVCKEFTLGGNDGSGDWAANTTEENLCGDVLILKMMMFLKTFCEH